MAWKRRLALGACLALSAFAPVVQESLDRNPKNDPANCPYCFGDPDLMAKGGIVSHGGYEFGNSDTLHIDDFLANTDIRWIESEHFEIGFAGPPYRLSGPAKKRVQVELTELAKAFPEINPKTKLLDPWLRAHLYAARAERIWVQFVELMEIDLTLMNDGRGPWNGKGEYHGEGPYLGEKGKYEVLILPGEGDLTAYLRDQFGLTSTITSRWNVPLRDTLSVTMHLRQGKLSKDEALHGHVAFNLAHNMLDGYEHYSYDTPIWIHSGISHYMERLISPKHNSFDASEGATAKSTSKADWEPLVKKLVKSKKAPRMAELMALRTYAEMSLADHLATWSMVKFLFEEHRSGFAKVNKDLHGRISAAGISDSQNLSKVHREAFKRDLGMSYPQFDRAWRDWVLGVQTEDPSEAE